MPQVSVIIPVYKAEAYLERCVDSVLNQTFCDFELIMVDDGSPDRCGGICDYYAGQDKRVRVFHKENGGAAVARNYGLDNALGEYIAFVDADDYIHPKMLEVLWNALHQCGTQISCCGYVETHGQDIALNSIMNPVLRTPEDIHLRNSVDTTLIWAKLYSKECFRDIRFPSGVYYEDEYVTYRVMFSQETVAVVDTVLYAYFQSEDSLTRSVWYPNRMDMFPALEQQIDFYRERGLWEIAQRRVWAYVHNIQRQVGAIAQLTDDEKKKYQNILRGKMRWVIGKCKDLVPFSYLDHKELFEFAYPKGVFFFRCYWRFRQWISQIIRGSFGR